MKNLFTYGVSVWLSICVLFAGFGVPVFAHYCNMSNACKEISVIPKTNCCADNNPENNSSNENISKNSCCSTVYTFYKKDLSAIKNQATQESEIPAVSFFILPFDADAFSKEISVKNSIPPTIFPSFSGRDLLTEIQVLRI